MWDGVTYVEPSRRTVIHEGFQAAQLIVTNAGPGTVNLVAWREPLRDGDDRPDVMMHLPPGNTRSVSAPMIAVGLADGPSVSRSVGGSFAAVAWRVVR